MSALSNPLTSDSSTGNPLENPLASSANAGQYEVGDTIETIHGEMEVTGVDELGRPQVDRYGDDLNWEDSFGPASKHLGVSEGEWQEFIAGVNGIKAEMRQYEGNDARVMQTRSRGEDAQSARRIVVLMNQGYSQEEAEAEVYGSEGHAQRQGHQEEYDALNQQLNDLYASVGLDSAGAITGSGTNSPGYAVNFDLVSGDVSHSKGDAIHDIGKMAVMAAAGVVAGPAVAGALGGVLGPAAAKAASSAIINLATQYMSSGEVDWKQALISAATSYGGAKLGNALQGSSSLGGIGDKISGVTDKFNDILGKTGNIGSAAIKAGGMSMLTQMVTTGEIDAKQAGLAALMAGGSAGLAEWQASMESAGAEVTSDDLQEIVVEAKRVGTDVGGGMTALEGGTVINEAGEIIGNMDDIDLDGDGMLSGSDLQEITTPDRDLINTNENIYGDVDLAPPGSTTNPTAFTKEWANERYGSLSESQTISAMQRDGFTDDQIDAYIDGRYDDIDAINPNIVTHAGGWVENMEQPYTLEYRDGRHYIIMDGKLKAISEDAYTDLYADLNSGGDWQQTMNEYGVTSGGEVFGGYDEYGRPVYNQSATVDDWITLDGSQPPVSAPIDDFVDAEPDPVDTPEADPVETPDNQTDSDKDGGTGTDGGNTSATIGGDDGATGALGGGSTSGGSSGGSSSGGYYPSLGDIPTNTGGGGTAGNSENDTTPDNTTDGTGQSTGDNTTTGDGGTSTSGDTTGDTGDSSTDADADGDANSTGDNTGNDTSGDSTGSDTSGDSDSSGDGDVTGSGPDSGTNGNNNAGGATIGTATGVGNTPGTGIGNTPGGGVGDGSGGGGLGGGGLGMLGGSGGDGRPGWGPLFPGRDFRKFEKRRSGIVQSLFEDLMK